MKPEVPGGFGPRTVIDRSGSHMVVTRLHFVFDGWLGDALLASSPVFIATAELALAILQKRLSGVRLAPVEVERSPRFLDIYPDRPLPAFRWLQVDGVAGRDDLGLLRWTRLVVSDRALALFRTFGIQNARIHPYEGEEMP